MPASRDSQQDSPVSSVQAINALSPGEKRALLAQFLRREADKSLPSYPLSDNQQGIWFLCQLAPESSIYNVSFAGRIRSAVDIRALRCALQTLIDRHPSLRTTFAVHAGKPAQRVHEHQTVRFEVTDTSTCREDTMQARLVAETLRPFDLERGPVMRASLFTRSAHEHVLLLVVHHIVIDFWSLAIILNELGALYLAERSGQPSSLPPPGRPYTDFVRWQFKTLTSPVGEQLWDYWKAQLAGPLPVLDLPTDRPRPPVQLYRGAQHDFTLSGELAQRLRALAKAEGATLYMVLLAAFELMLFHHSGQEDILVASPMVGRSRAEFEGVVGFFANPVILRADLSGNPDFRSLLARVRQTVLAALEHQDYPTLRLIQGLRPPRDLSRPPLCQTMFVLDKPHRVADRTAPEFAGVGTGLRMSLGGFEMESIPLERRAATLDLVMLIIETSDSLATSIRFNTDLFDIETISRMAGHFHVLLESAIRDPATTIGEMAILTDAERRQLLVAFNDTRTDVPSERCLHHLFEEQVARTPNCLAVTFEGQQLTYEQLDARANQLARRLQTLRVQPDVPVAICMEPCPEMIVGVLGILKAGGAYLPLDPAYPKERLAFMLRDAQVPVILTRTPWLERLPDHAGTTLCLDPGLEAIAPESERAPLSAATARSLAYVIYTSGSTGQPKGVMCEHAGLVNYLRWVNDGPLADPEFAMPLTTKLTFDMCLKQLFPPLLRGGEVWIIPEEVVAEPGLLLSALAQRPKVALNCVPSLWTGVLQAMRSGHAAPPGLTRVIFGGETLSKELVARSFAALPHLQIWNIYGPTEATANASAARITSADAVTIGRPIANARIYILNPLRQPVPIGVQGELYIGGAGVARGYLNRPDMTAERFVSDPFSAVPGARMYKTGDLARYRADGTIEFLGRADHQVKVRGFRIELGEIEAALGQHPAVREAVVLAQEDVAGDPADAAGRQKRLVAYVVAEPGLPPTTTELRDFLQQKLPEYMVPAIFVPLDALPLMPNGKIDRQALRVPGGLRPRLDGAFVAPRTLTEELLAGIWGQLLEIDLVGTHDNFFDLGGHSLLATQLMSRVREAFQVEIPLRRLFEAPTVAGLAESIDAARQAGHVLSAPPILPVPRNGDLALSFAQQRLWFLDRLAPGLPAYNIPAAVRLQGPLNLAALERGLNAIVNRHEALRTTFREVDGCAVQVIAPTLTIKLPVVDLRDRSASAQEAEVRRLVNAEAERPFDLSRGPLLRGTVLRLSDTEHVGLLTMHHIVSDGWSTGILVRELATLYSAFCAGGSPLLPELPIQYADFAHWQRTWLQGDVLESQLAYWKGQLIDAPDRLDLPTDHPRPALQTFRGAHQSLALPEQLRADIQALSRQEGVTQFMAFLAAFQALLYRYTGQDDLIVGTPIANRNRLETEGLIGLFVNSLVLRTNLSGNPGFREVLRRVRETCLGAYAHQDLPFDRLVEELHVQRDLNRNPLFQVMFVLQTASPRAIELPGAILSSVEGDIETAHVDLTLVVADTGQEMTATFVYNVDLFDADTIARLLGHFRTLLLGALVDPGQRLADLPLLGEAERRQLLVEWQGPASNSRHDVCIHQLFEAQVARTPDAVAVVFEAQQLTYGELNRRANYLAHHLRALGVGPEVPVAICLERSLEMVVGLLGILKAGGAYLPLDPAYPKERLALMLQDAQVPVLLTREQFAAGLADQGAAVVCLDSDWEAIAHRSADNPVGAAGPEALAYVIYTSGSTGQPKGVLVPHDALLGHCLNVISAYGLDSRDIVLQFAAPSFDVSLEEILPTLVAGARLVVMGPDIWYPAELHRKIAECGLTVLNLPTPYWQELAREWAHAPDLVPAIPPRLCIVGSDAMSPDALRLWRLAPVGSIRLLNGYGPTETTITATALEIAPHPGRITAERSVPIGRPLAGRTAYVLDQHGNQVPVGVAGHLHIGGAGVARGYLNRPDLTAEAFVPDPFSSQPGARMYRTGDLARFRADGNIEFLGRADQQVKIRGFRIELGEIEATLGQHPAVREAVVLAREDTPGQKQLVAYVVADATSDELRRFLKNKLPEFMVPAVVVLLDALPVTAHGKLDRRLLPAPDRSRLQTPKVFVAPSDDLELQLVHIWEEILDVRPVGVSDNFFELGGHSLMAVRLFALIEKQLGKRLPLTSIFQGATIADLAQVLRQHATSGPGSSLVPIQSRGSRPPLFLVHPAGGHVFPYIQLGQLLGADQPCYGLQARGAEDGHDPDTRIEDMAAHYVQALQIVQQTGPYFLGGWSMGGVIAFEMAQQLLAQNQKVAFLAILDGRVPSPGDTFPEQDAEAAAMAERYFGISFGLTDSLALLPEDEQLAVVLEEAKAAGLVPAELDVAQARRFVMLLRNDLRATETYEPHRYPGRVTLFRASETLAGASDDPTMGWSEWADGGVEVHVVPGNHANLMYPPHVQALAESLTACLDQTYIAITEQIGVAVRTDDRRNHV